MIKQQREPAKFPAKPKTFEDGATVNFNKLYDDAPSALVHYPQSGGYQEKYPSVYSVQFGGEGYVKSYDFIPDEYFENRGLIDYDQMSLYNYIGSLSNRGYYCSLKGSKKDSEVKGLAKLMRVRVQTLIEWIDRLEDCFLVHRVRRLDLRGMPSELVYHTGFTARQLNAGKQKIITDRIARSHTKNTRNKAVRFGGSGERGDFAFLDRRATNEQFQFDYRIIKNAFGGAAPLFTDFALAFFKAHLGLLEHDFSQFNALYRLELKRKMTEWGIGKNAARESCYKAANKFRAIYCPTFAELCGDSAGIGSGEEEEETPQASAGGADGGQSDRFSTGELKEKSRDHIISTLRDLRAGDGTSFGWTPETDADYVDFFRHWMDIFSLAELSAINDDVKFFPNEKWMKICDELRE